MVRSVGTTPIAGVYVVETPTEVFYVDSTGRYGFAGAALIDMQNQVDLTASHLEKVQRIKFDALPLAHAIKEVRGTGARKLAVFEDPHCPICKVFTKFIDQLDDVTVYKFPFPVIGPESVPLARIACDELRLQPQFPNQGGDELCLGQGQNGVVPEVTFRREGTCSLLRWNCLGMALLQPLGRTGVSHRDRHHLPALGRLSRFGRKLVPGRAVGL